MASTGSTAQIVDNTWSRQRVSARVNARRLVLTSYEKSAIDVDTYARAVIAYSKSDAEVNRRRATARRLHLLRDEWGPLLKAKLENWLTSRSLDAILGKNRDNLDISRNPFRHICSELAVAYKSPPRRFTKEKADGEKYQALVANTGFELFWRQVELVLEACNEVVIWPEVITRQDGRKIIKHRWVTGNAVTAVYSEDDPTELECLLFLDQYKDLSGNDHERYQLWTDEWHAQFEYRDGELQRAGMISDIAAEEDISAKNPYGEFPHVVVRKNQWPDIFWDVTTGEDLIDLTLTIGIAKAFYNYMRKMSGFKQGVAVGNFDKVPPQLLDPGELLHIPGEGKFDLVDWQVDLKAYLDCIEREELAAAARNGINPERYKQTANYQTGFSAAASERGLSEHRTKRVPIWVDTERQYKRKLAIVASRHGIEKTPNPDEQLFIEHAPLAYPTDPKAQSDLDTADVARGLESPVTLYIKRHPDMDEKAAKDAILNNMKITAEINDMKASRQLPDNPENQSAEAERQGRLGPQIRDGRQVQDENSMQTPGRNAAGKQKGDR